MFVGSCLRTFRDRQLVPSLRQLEDGTEELECFQVYETGRFVLVSTKTIHYNVLGQFNVFHAAKCTTRTCGYLQGQKLL